MTAENVYQVELEIQALDRPQLALEIMSTLVEMKIPLNSINARTAKHGRAIINLIIEIRVTKQLSLLINKLKKISGMFLTYFVNNWGGGCLMRVVVQRVKTSAVSVKGTIVAQIDKGLLVFFGGGGSWGGMTKNDVDYLVRKIINLRVLKIKMGN